MNELIAACQAGEATKFKQLFSEAEKPVKLLERQDKRGKALIHYAAEGGSTDIISIILDKGGPEQAASESYYESDTPLNVALMSKKLTAASMLFEKMKELNVNPRKNKHGNYPLHFAAEDGSLDFMQALADAFPDTIYAKNNKGKTPLSFAVSSGNIEGVKILLGRERGPPTEQFRDFTTVFPTYMCHEEQLDTPMNVFVLGENNSGKSSVIKSIQVQSAGDRFWGVAYNTPHVDQHKIGLVPTDFPSKQYGRVMFHDLASGSKYLKMQFVNTPEDVRNSLFFVVIDCRPERRDMERKLEFWLSVVRQICSQVTTNDYAPPLPNVLVLASFLDYTKAFRHVNEIRLDNVFRRLATKNPELIASLNVIDRVALDSRKAQSPQMSKVRAVLRSRYRRRRGSVEPVDYQCYALSSILKERAMISKVPVMTLEELSQEIREKQSDQAITLHSLVPADVSELMYVCQTLEERNRVMLLRNGPEEDTVVIHDMVRVASMVDNALLELMPPEGQPPNPQIALMEEEKLQDYLKEALSLPVDVIIPILDSLKIHSLSIQDETHSRGHHDQLFYFIPMLLPDNNPDPDEWGDTAYCFAWTYKPGTNQMSRYFLPSYTNHTLIALFNIGTSIDALNFEHRMLWQRGFSLRQKEEAEIVVVITSTSITLNMRYSKQYEIICLHLRNRLLKKVRSLKQAFQPDVETEESIIPADGARFPVSSPTPATQIRLEELRKKISRSTLSLGRSSLLSIPQSQQTQESVGSASPDQLFFEPCWYLGRLDTLNQEYLMSPQHANRELTNSFLSELRHHLDSYYGLFEQYFNLPPIVPTTPASSVTGGSQLELIHPPPHVAPPPSPRHHRSSSFNFECNTFGKLVECLNSISIFNVAEFLAEYQRAEISGDTSIQTGSSSGLTGRHSPRLSDRTPTPLETAPRLTPYTTRSTEDRPNVYFVGPLQAFTCGSAGGVFHSARDGISIKFPSGAVPEGSPPITVEFGVALNGPFEFPADYTPISPFMWFSTNAPDFIFAKSVEIFLPHYMNLRGSDAEKLAFLKANHRDAEDDEFEFRECTEKTKFKSQNNHGVLYTKHTCFLCISRKVSQAEILKANYCLMKVVPKSPGITFKVHFCLTYFLSSCMETVRDQFSSEDYDITTSLVELDYSIYEPQVSIYFDTHLEHGWTATNEGGQTLITAKRVDFSDYPIDQLKLLNTHQMYPPRFTIQVCGMEATRNSILKVRFEGLKSTSPINYEIQLHKPSVPVPLPHQNSEASVGSHVLSSVGSTSGPQGSIGPQTFPSMGSQPPIPEELSRDEV